MRCTNILTYKGHTGSVEIKNGKLCGSVNGIKYTSNNLDNLQKAFEKAVDGLQSPRKTN